MLRPAGGHFIGGIPSPFPDTPHAGFASVVVVTATITVTHISDPGCPWAWSAAPHHAVLHWRYGSQLAW